MSSTTHPADCGQTRSMHVPAWARCLGLAIAMLVSAASAQAQTRSFQSCFTVGVQSCTWLELTTTALFNDGGARIGTGVDIDVRHNEGTTADAALRSALTGFFFSYAGAEIGNVGAVDVIDDAQLLAPLFYVSSYPAPDPIYSDGWRHSAQSSTSSSSNNFLSFINVLGVYDDATALTTTQYIGGCGVGAASGSIDAIFATEVWTCGDGLYRFSTFTEAWFDVNEVNTVGVTTYAQFSGADFGVAAFCDRYLDTNTSFGDADGTFTNFGDVCGASAPVEPPPAVPEPSALYLLAAGIVAAGWVRRRGVQNAL